MANERLCAIRSYLIQAVQRLETGFLWAKLQFGEQAPKDTIKNLTSFGRLNAAPGAGIRAS